MVRPPHRTPFRIQERSDSAGKCRNEVCHPSTLIIVCYITPSCVPTQSFFNHLILFVIPSIDSPVKRGILITFEGGEGTGKTTQIRNLALWLKRRGEKVVVTREPGGTMLADRIRQVLLNPRNRGMHPTLELLLYQAARRDHVERVIQPSLRRREVVLCDRFTDATLAYQGFGRGISLPTVRALNQAAARGIRPTRTFLFDLPPRLGLQRAKSRGGRDRFHEEARRFHERVRRGYLTLARREQRRFRVIDARLTRQQVLEKIQQEVQRIL